MRSSTLVERCEWPQALGFVFLVVCTKEHLGVVIHVGAGLATIEMWGWDPFGGAVFAFASFPAAGCDEFVVGTAALGEIVDVGFPACGEVGDVVNFGEVTRHVAVWEGAPTILGKNVEVMHHW